MLSVTAKNGQMDESKKSCPYKNNREMVQVALVTNTLQHVLFVAARSSQSQIRDRLLEG